MKVINIQVTDVLKVTSVVDGNAKLNSSQPIKIASGNYKSVLLNFDFVGDSLNETATKYATFSLSNSEQIQVQLEKIGSYNNACYVPYSVLKTNGRVALGVYGVSTYNSKVAKLASPESAYFLVVNGSFNTYLTDETPPNIETLQNQLETDMASYIDALTKEFNDNYTNKINNLNSNILNIETDAETATGITFNQYADAKRIEQSIEHFFSLTPDDKVYTVRFPLWNTSNTCKGEKLDDNVGKYVNLATDTVREETNYGPAWQSIDCNAVVDSNGVRHITALKGMTTFRDTGKVDVFCLFRTYYQKIWEEGGYLYISRTFLPKEGYTVVPQAINKDGSINQWFVIGKYVVGTIDGRLYSSKGLIPAHYLGNSSPYSNNINYNDCVNKMHQRGTYYSAGLMSDYMHILTTFYLKFATKNTQSIMAGNTMNSYQYQVSKNESNVKRVVLTTAQANNFDINTYISVGDPATNTNRDRTNGYMHNIAYNVKIVGKEVVDNTHTALILDSQAFNTTSTTWVSTMHEVSGYSDYILGRTGSIGSNTNGKHGIVLDGIEIAVGGYEVAGNAFMDIIDATSKREVYITNDASKLTTNVTTAKANYKKSNLVIQPTKVNAWNPITEYQFDMNLGLAVPTKSGVTGSGTSVGYADSLYVDGNSSGQREFLLLGSLNTSDNAGLWCVYGNNALLTGGWNILARLSINGVGGELA